MDPHVIVGLKRSFIRQKITNVSTVPYIEDPTSTSLYNRGAEIEVSLTSSKLFPDTVSVTFGDTILSGKLISVNNKYITVEGEDGKLVTTRYDLYRNSEPRYEPQTYRVIYNPEGVETNPELNYFTGSISWTPVIRIVIDGKASTMSFNAIINSTRETPLRAKFTLAAFEEITGISHRYARSLPMLGSSASYASSSEGEGDLVARPFVKEIDEEFTLFQHVIYPIYINEIAPVRVAIVDIDAGAKQMGPAVVGHILRSPFNFPSCELELRERGYYTHSQITSYQRKQRVMLRTYASITTRYTTTVSTISSQPSSTAPTQYQTVIDLELERNSLDTETIIITYHIGNVKLINVEPPVTAKLQLPGKLIWATKTSAAKTQNQFVIRYED